MKSPVTCSYCGDITHKENGAINRAKKQNKSMYCNRLCSSKAKKLTDEEKKENKRLYDIEYRRRPDYKQKKYESYKRNYDKEKERIKRKVNMYKHIEYCRQPEYRKKKKEYDKLRRSKIKYGEFSGVHLLLMDLEDEITERATKYQISLENQTINKAQRRKRNEQRFNSDKP